MGVERPSFDDVVRAAERIAGHVERTPMVRSQTLTEITGAEVFIKFENLQFTASYQERGALNRLLQLPPGTSGVVTASAGNFAQGVAHHATRLGMLSTIVMPRATPALKIARTEALGAEVLLRGDTFEEAQAIACQEAARRDAVLLSPFNDSDVIAGQGTVALEMLADTPDLDALLIPVGGGGLLAGCSLVASATSSHVDLVGVQTTRYPAVFNAAHHQDRASGGSTIAEGIAVSEPGELTLAMIMHAGCRIELVAEEMIEQAVALYLEVEKTVSEGAGAVGLAALLEHPEMFRGRQVGVLISGGNIDLRQLALITLRSLTRSGRLTDLVVEMDDQPGRLGAAASAIGAAGGNIVEVVHQRVDPAVRLRSTVVRFTVETTGRAHLDRVIAALTEIGEVSQQPIDRTVGL